MIVTVIHSSKTMRRPAQTIQPLDRPALLQEAKQLARVWRTADTDTLQKRMHISAKKADEVATLFEGWTDNDAQQIPAVDAFIGDIYSGLQVQSWTETDRRYAHAHLLVLSGLYGALRACDGIMPYRLEMGYTLPDGKSMYAFWGDSIASLISSTATTILNLSAVEYTKALLPYTEKHIVTPKFMTVSPKTGEPVFVAVHAKIARGAFARWVIQKRIEDPALLTQFNELGYHFDEKTSTDEQPVFICTEFGGLGLSVRLK